MRAKREAKVENYRVGIDDLLGAELGLVVGGRVEEGYQSDNRLTPQAFSVNS